MIKQLVTKYVTKITVRIHATRSAVLGQSVALGPSAFAQSLNAFCLRRTYRCKSGPSLLICKVNEYPIRHPHPRSYCAVSGKGASALSAWRHSMPDQGHLLEIEPVAWRTASKSDRSLYRGPPREFCVSLTLGTFAPQGVS